MPWLPLYMDREDLDGVIGMLNADREIAVIVPDGRDDRRRWRAVNEIRDHAVARYCFWHVPSGPLPLIFDDRSDQEWIKNPFDGWEEKRQGADPSNPYFGPGHPGIVWLNNNARDENRIGLSSFEWIGDHYRTIGSPAPEITKKWWKRLRKEIAALGVKIGRTDAMKPEIYCLKGAMTKIVRGMERDKNP